MEKNGIGKWLVVDRFEIAIMAIEVVSAFSRFPRMFRFGCIRCGSRHQDPMIGRDSVPLRNSMFLWLGGRRGRAGA